MLIVVSTFETQKLINILALVNTEPWLPSLCTTLVCLSSDSADPKYLVDFLVKLLFLLDRTLMHIFHCLH